MKGWVIATGSAVIQFLTQTSNSSRKLTFDIGLWKIIFFILFKAAATIRNFTVIKTQLGHSPPSILIRFQFCLVCLKELGSVHRTSSRFSEILIIN